MSTTPTTRYQEKQDSIFAVASRVFAEKGYHQASMRDIAKESGASLAGLYYYAQSKEELLYVISKRAFETVIEGARRATASTVDPAEQLTRVIDNHLLYFADHLDEMKVLSHEAESLTGEYGESVQALKRTYVTLVEEVLRNLGDSDSVRIQALSLFGMMNWIYTWYRPEEGGIETIRSSMTDLFLHGFTETVASKN